jgi:hypothetical protein
MATLWVSGNSGCGALMQAAAGPYVAIWGSSGSRTDSTVEPSRSGTPSSGRRDDKKLGTKYRSAALEPPTFSLKRAVLIGRRAL